MKPNPVTEMECGSSLAEDAWTVPSIAGGMAAVSMGADDAYAGVGGGSSSTANNATNGKTITNYKNDVSYDEVKSNGGEEMNRSNSSVEEAWAKINQLRSQLAADVIMDPPNQKANGDGQSSFPTFISPFELPTTKTTQSNPTTLHKPYQGMTTPLLYCDHTASHRPLNSIENYLRATSMPCHANTHTNITYTGSQSTAFVSEARQIVAESTGARVTGKASLDCVLFCGNGVTGCVGVLVDCLNLRGVVEGVKKGVSSGSSGSDGGWMEQRPVVFVGPHEHHSNLIPWRESGCEVVTVPENPSNGMVNLSELQRLLQLPQYSPSSNRLRMGAFSAVSNVTGLIANVDAIAILLHRYGALAFFDYASGAPYLKMDMNAKCFSMDGMEEEGMEDLNQLLDSTTGVSGGEEGLRNKALDPSKDAIYFSPHKCFGGTSTPGVLVMKKHLISQMNPPLISGGGTVFYVTNEDHRFLSNRIERYEGGTPDGLGIQRVGLALLAGRRVDSEYERIVQSVTVETETEGEKIDDGSKRKESRTCPPKTLLEFECSTYDRVVSELKKHAPNLIMLGNYTDSNSASLNSSSSNSTCIGRQLPIFSFLIRCGRRFLHYNYVCAILNDVFGIQSRGGCQCAGPYSQRLLGLTSLVTCEVETNEISDTNQQHGLAHVEVPNEANRKIERALLRSDRPCELLRPGYTRLSLPFKGLRGEEVEYVIQALIWVAKNGWMLLPQYRCDHRTGEWRHWSRRGKPLGKSERRWLSHFDILRSTQTVLPSSSLATSLDNTEASRIRLSKAIENANAILEAARSDPRFISEVEKMNSVDGMLGSGGDPGMGGIDDTLEELRWYVYQRECAKYLRDGLEQVPDTFDDDALLGSIDVRMDGKCKRNVVVESAARDGAESGGNLKLAMKITSKPDVFSFREGDHMGEATFDEIKAGYDDGELTKECEVFHWSREEWIPFEEFIRESEADAQNSRKRNLSDMADGAWEENGVSSCQSMECEDSPSAEAVQPMNIHSNISKTSQSPARKQVLTNALPPALEKREKKKVSRDSSQWGQCSAPHVVPTESCAVISSGKESDNIPQYDTNSSNATDVVPMNAAKAMTAMAKRKRIKPPPKMLRFITQAMIQWNMIEEGDRLLLGLSGGKDSLSLLHCLLEFQRKLPIKFDLEVCTIDPMTPSFDPSPLIPYVKSFGLKYHYIRDDIVARANTSGKDGKIVSSLCSFCARMKRGNLYSCARKNNCNKLVLAQHLDDCAESFLMSVMHNGFIRTMKANYRINAGDVSVIRPLVYCRESIMTEFAKSANLPVINENCPACFEEPKERARVKKLLSREETLYPNLYDHIRRALIPVMHDDSTAIMRSYLEDTIAKSRKNPSEKSKKGTKKKNGNFDEKVENPTSNGPNNPNRSLAQHKSISLESATEEELVAELAKRRAAKYKLSGAMKRLPEGEGEDEDPTGQVCSLAGGNGTIPCRELME